MRKAFLQTFLLFNVGVAIAIYTCHGAGVMGDLGGTILHTILAVLTGYFYFRDNTRTAYVNHYSSLLFITLHYSSLLFITLKLET